MTHTTDRVRSAVILARGLGTRMRRADASSSLGSHQSAAADTGIKGMIPIGRPFMDYLISAIADAGYSRVCIVIGPEHGSVREHYVMAAPKRVSIEFAIQEKALGTADAVLAAEPFAGGEPFIVLNSDNYYPSAVLTALREVEAPALAAFARSALIEAGNVPPERVGRFGALQIDDEQNLVSISPRNESLHDSQSEVYASMNCWLFDRRIFAECRKVAVSPRGELELPRAVQMSIDSGRLKFRVVRLSAPVLDLSTRGDIASVERRLAGVEVNL